MIKRLPPDVDPLPPRTWDESEPGWGRSHALWNAQQAFDTRLHEDRRLRYPRDAQGAERAASRREWVLGQAFALLEELGELLEAREAQNPDEETVDTLHFTLSLAEKLGMTPAELGRFEDRFEAAAEEARRRSAGGWEDVLMAVLPDYVMALADLKGAHFKWWKNQPAEPDWKPQKDALLRADRCNLMVASRVFGTAEAMFTKYMEKVMENHQRQQGLIAGRETYQAA